MDGNGQEIGDAAHIGNKNPFRYRSYYFDTETGLYYLKSRYYDPEICRFITIDDISYINPETINGLNLYAYCGNNPVINIDPNGNAWWKFWEWNWGKIFTTIAIAFVSVVAIAATIVTLGATSPLLVAGIVGGVAAFSANVISQGIEKGYNNIDWGDTIIQTLSGIAYGIASVALPGVGGIIAKTAISVGTTVITDSYHGVGIGSILKNAASAFGLSLLFQGAKYLGVFDKLNFSHLIGNGRWVDFVSDKVFNKTLIMMDFGNYFIREFVVAGVSFGQRIVKWLWNNL